MLINKNTLLENEISLLINLFNKGSYSEVIEQGKVIITKHSLSYVVYNIIGSAYSKIKKYDEALNYYRKSVEINLQFFPYSFFFFQHTINNLTNNFV